MYKNDCSFISAIVMQADDRIGNELKRSKKFGSRTTLGLEPSITHEYKPWKPIISIKKTPLSQNSTTRTILNLGKVIDDTELRKEMQVMTALTYCIDIHGELLDGKFQPFDKLDLCSKIEANILKNEKVKEHQWKHLMPYPIVKTYILVLTKLMAKTFYSYAAVAGYFYKEFFKYFRDSPLIVGLWEDHQTVMTLGKALLAMHKLGDKELPVHELLNDFRKAYRKIKSKTAFVDKRGSEESMQEKGFYSLMPTWSEYCRFSPTLSPEQNEIVFEKAISGLDNFTMMQQFLDNNRQSFAYANYFDLALPILNQLANYEFGYRGLLILRQLFYQTFPNLDDAEFMKLTEKGQAINLPAKHAALSRVIPEGNTMKFLKDAKSEERVAALHYNLLFLPWDGVLLTCIGDIYNNSSDVDKLLKNLLPSVKKYLMDSNGEEERHLYVLLKRLNVETDGAAYAVYAVISEFVNSGMLDMNAMVFEFLFPAALTGSVPFRKCALQVIEMLIKNQLTFQFSSAEQVEGAVSWSELVNAVSDLYAIPNPTSQAGQRYAPLKTLLYLLDEKGADEVNEKDVMLVFEHLNEKNATKAWTYLLGSELMAKTLGKYGQDQLPWQTLDKDSYSELLELIIALPDTSGVNALFKLLQSRTDEDEQQMLRKAIDNWVNENRGHYKPGDTRIMLIDKTVKIAVEPASEPIDVLTSEEHVESKDMSLEEQEDDSKEEEMVTACIEDTSEQEEIKEESVHEEV